jgi:type VI secretion system protein ImpG
MRVDDGLLHYYQRELTYLREQGAAFAQRHPQLAARLALDGAESPDPHTERLIEAQAFLAARVHRDLDREFPQVASALLEQLAPTLTQPIPATTVVQMTLDPSQGKVTAGLRVPRHTPLLATGADGQTCRLRSAWDSVVWPLQVIDTRLVDGRQLQLHLRCADGVDLAELELDALRLHVGGDWNQAVALHELLVTGVQSIALCDGDGRVQPLARRQWRELGFDPQADVLPRPAHAAPAHSLLQTLFASPRSFHFFELTGLRGRLGRGRECELRFDLPGAAARLPGPLDAQALRCGCVPAVNLFECSSEPIRIDPRQQEFRLRPGRRSEAQPEPTEVVSVLSVQASDPDGQRSHRIPSFAAMDLSTLSAGAGVFWSARRDEGEPAERVDSALWLAFTDSGQAAVLPPEPVVWARLLCSNGRLAAAIGSGTRLQAQGVSAALQVHSLYPATPARPAPLAAQALWQLVALLRLNHGALQPAAQADTPQARSAALRDLLLLLSDRSARDLALLRGLRDVTTRPAVARLAGPAWQGPCRGTDVELDFDEEAFIGGSPLLLCAVLARFLALHTTVNSFVRLSVRRRHEIWYQWPPQTGYQPLI